MVEPDDVRVREAEGGVGVGVGERCITCADEAVRVEVLRLDGPERARCLADHGWIETVETALVGPVRPGDVLLVHAGVALVRLDER